MLTIRLQRVGKRNQPEFRIVLAEKHRSATKKVVEILGNYNPRTKEFKLKNEERLKYWIAQHVQLSGTIHNLFVTRGFVTGKKVQAWKPKKKTSETAPAAAPSPAASAEAKQNPPKQAPPETAAV